MVKNLPPNAGDLRSISGWGTNIPQAAEQLRAHSLTRGFPCSSAGKEFACNAGDAGSIHGLGISPGKGNGNPPQCSCRENPMDRGAWQATYSPWGSPQSMGPQPRALTRELLSCKEDPVQPKINYIYKKN